MYTPQHCVESRVEVMHDLIRRHPLATLVTLNRGGGIVADHIPLLICETLVPFGSLQGHVARANPLWTDARQDIESLVVFQGPDAYISPSWYATKQETGRVVPTWNYAVVHAYGMLRVIDDADWIRSQIDRLTAAQETGFWHPWRVVDAPADYIQQRIRAIVGIELVITRLLGKWKMSQNQADADRAGVISGLRSQGPSNGPGVADLVPPPNAS